MNSPNQKPWQNSTPWQQLRQFTAARIALGRAGASLPTDAVLQFGFAHAQARDAVHATLNTELLITELGQEHFTVFRTHSCALDRNSYLKRPDLGRQLAEESKIELQSSLLKSAIAVESIGIVIADGLSAVAVQSHAVPLLLALRQQWHINWNNVPIVIATQARVALGDAIAEIVKAKLIIVLIGERPGLSSPDSLGAYLTYAPYSGCTDAQRNCVSNIRPVGLHYPLAAAKIKWLSENALSLRLSGVNLKDNSDQILLSCD